MTRMSDRDVSPHFAVPDETVQCSHRCRADMFRRMEHNDGATSLRVIHSILRGDVWSFVVMGGAPLQPKTRS